ncbi:hypothetical protein [Nocardioides halotolerans]|uniref:hypothetical protein n=1 Tax=Nocardioides halotolerans TaxID=433660 RepID=UPI00048CFA0F|nr:hypothetical protein [Nocardioides halotolerans]
MTATADAQLYGTTTDAAEWLAQVGLGGRYAAVPGLPRWVRRDGDSWVECDVGEVQRAVRRALGSVCDRRMEEYPPTAEVIQLLRLMDLNWRLGPLMAELRRVAVQS